ncbi:MAG: GlsB/YeaQ/YmgE family stress response membrane protein [Oscillospiraceae bacterium]|nr:GlsB/YeaQ/YmgE family stress response membrane protein [Oscillospiraceae bacterium]
MRLVVELIIGGLCGLIANKIMDGNSSSIIRNVILGLAGGFVGGLIGNLLGVGGGWVTGVILSIAGACLVVWIARKFFK